METQTYIRGRRIDQGLVEGEFGVYSTSMLSLLRSGYWPGRGRIAGAEDCVKTDSKISMKKLGCVG